MTENVLEQSPYHSADPFTLGRSLKRKHLLMANNHLVIFSHFPHCGDYVCLALAVGRPSVCSCNSVNVSAESVVGHWQIEAS